MTFLSLCFYTMASDQLWDPLTCYLRPQSVLIWQDCSSSLFPLFLTYMFELPSPPLRTPVGFKLWYMSPDLHKYHHKHTLDTLKDHTSITSLSLFIHIKISPPFCNFETMPWKVHSDNYSADKMCFNFGESPFPANLRSAIRLCLSHNGWYSSSSCCSYARLQLTLHHSQLNPSGPIWA